MLPSVNWIGFWISNWSFNVGFSANDNRVISIKWQIFSYPFSSGSWSLVANVRITSIELFSLSSLPTSRLIRQCGKYLSASPSYLSGGRFRIKTCRSWIPDCSAISITLFFKSFWSSKSVISFSSDNNQSHGQSVSAKIVFHLSQSHWKISRYES